MHIPDGFLSTEAAIGACAVSAGAVGYAVTRARRTLDERSSLLMGISAAFIFAAQMLNFPVAGGTSGHLLGGALAAILLGPWVGSLVLTAVLAVQALLFQDGGLLALGANVLNMAVIGVFIGWAVHRALLAVAGTRRWGLTVGGFVAGWLSVVVASAAAALELAVSGTLPLNVALPAITLVHMLIGVGEGIITVAVLLFLQAARPDLLMSAGPMLTAEGT